MSVSTRLQKMLRRYPDAMAAVFEQLERRAVRSVHDLGETLLFAFQRTVVIRAGNIGYRGTGDAGKCVAQPQ